MKGYQMYQLAQINIGRLLAPLDDPQIAGFVAKLDEINALADKNPGFVWRLQSNEGNATSLRPYEDEQILVNMSVWASLEAYTNYVYKTAHREVMKMRRQWFERFDGPYTAVWWVPQGHIPTVAEAKERLEYLRAHGASPFAFTPKNPFPSEENKHQTVDPILDECPA
jgi:heme-degrading monooxygenase HmoA